MKRTVLYIFLFILVFSATIWSQREQQGRVVEILDGRTLIVETSGGGRFTVQLQYIEVPVPSQPFSTVVNDHLKRLAVGKNVQFQTNRISGSRLISGVFSDNIDISQQMLRDGAAWFSPSETAFQNTTELVAYKEMEKLAKQESRGIWGVAGLKPSWEVEAEKKKIATANSAKTVQSPSPLVAEVRRAPGLDQFDLIGNTASAASSRPSLAHVSHSERVAIGKAIDAFETMRRFLKDLEVTGMSLNEYDSRLAELRYEVNGATYDLPNGKLKLTIRESMKILEDLGIIFRTLNKNGFLYYRQFESFAKKYLLEPTRNNAGDHVLYRKDIIGALADKAFQNYSEIKKSLREQAKYAN